MVGKTMMAAVAAGNSLRSAWRQPFALVPLLMLLIAGAAPMPARAQAINGTVFEDVNYGGGAGRDSASASGISRPSARAELYDAGGVFTASTTTDASGAYLFSSLVAGTYFVRVVNGSVSSSRAGFVPGTHLSIQTFRTDASSGSAVAVTDYVGGTDPTSTDPGNGGPGTVFNTTTFAFTAGLSGTAQSVSRVVLGASDVVDIDFGFNFNTILNTSNAGQGSLRQFLTNANGLSNAGLAIAGQAAGTDVSIFMISNGAAHPGQRPGLPNQLDGSGTAVVVPSTVLPVILGAQTVLDGTTQTANIGNTNPLTLGAGGTVGVDALAIGQVPGPEVAIRDNGALTNGIEINANNVTVRGLAIYGFGNAAPDAGVLIDNGVTGALIEENVLGTTSSSFTDPGVALHNRAGLYSNGGDNGTIRNNLMGFSGLTGIILANGSSNWVVSGNEVRDSGTESNDGDGITVNASSTNAISGNRVTGSSSQGIVVTAAGATGNTFANNTVTGNGVGTPAGFIQSSGFAMRSGIGSQSLDRNVIAANYGAGIQVNNGAAGILMTRNSFATNGTITARNGAAATGQIGIDLNAAGDNINLGTAPFYTLNDAGDADAGGNALLNFPVLTAASISGGNLVMTGFARPGSNIEFFISDGDASGFGEGQTYLFTAAEGGGADTDAGTGTYGPGAVNGLVQGTDTTNRFTFTVPLPGGVVSGTLITATASLAGNTSECSGVVQAVNAAAITVAPTSGLTTTEAGGPDSFTVVLFAPPTADVTIGLSSSDLTEGTVAPASVTFTTVNWSVAQTVTVTGVDDNVDDGDIAYSIVTAAATSSDPAYNGINPSDVSVTNIDDDTAGITLNPTSGLTTTEAGGTATFTVVLNSEPTANVTVGVSSSDLTEGTVAPASITFDTINWSVAQTVTVTGVDDAVDDGDIIYSIVTAAATSSDVLYNGNDPTDVSVTNIDDDTAGITVNPTAGLTTTETGGTATFTVVLDTQPTADVSIALSSSDLTEGTVAPASLTFTTVNWSVARTVTVTGVDDAVDDGDIVYSIVTAAAASSDPAYNGINPSDVSVTNTDDDVAGITVNPTSGLTTTEAGGTATFTIVLNTQPTADVTVGLSSSDLTEGTVAPASVTFTTINWSVARTVTVTGVNDIIVDGNIAYTVITAAATSADPVYNGLDPSDVSVTNTDDDVAGITVNPTAGLITTEAGGTATFTVVLNTQPTSDVTIGMSSSDLTEGTVAPASVTFTTVNWSVARTVTVTGVNDLIVDGSIAYTAITAAATSADPAYNGMNPADVSVTNTDDDVAGVTVNPTSGLTTTEAGGTATFTVVLDTQPTADVTIGLSSSDLTEGTVAPASLTFTTVDWSVVRTVTVTGVNDLVVDGDIAYTVITAAAASADPAYNGFNPSDVSVTNTDDDLAGVTVNPISGLTTTEAGGTATFTVVLDSQPTADVTIGLSSSDLTEGTAAPASVTFTTLDWSIAQTVTVTGVNDLIVDGNIGYTIVTAAATSADPAYNGFNPSDVSATNTDDDLAGVTVNPTSGLTTTESGGAATFTIVLNTLPIANVTIGLSSSDLTEGTVAPASVTFTTLDWNVAQLITVTGVDDPILDGNIAYTIVTAAAASADPSYAGVAVADVGVVNVDDDTAQVIQLKLIADRERIEASEPVSFALHVHSLVTSGFAAVDIVREMPTGFVVLPGTATRDGRPIADPGGPQLAIGPLAALVDSNGNGRADPGEPGYALVRWRAVAGAGVFPGTKIAAATAVAGCSTCVVSNRAEAQLTVEESALLARGTLLGRVFEDRDRDGYQDRDEPGLFGATVALDDGTSVMTDADGLFHVPEVNAGQRLVKLDVARLPYPVTPTTDVATVARVSGGLLTSVRFGVAFDRDTLRVGSPPVRGLALIAEDLQLGIDVAGNAARPAVVINGTKVPIRTVDTRLPVEDSEEVLRLSGTRLDPPAVFELEATERALVRGWKFEIRSSADSLMRAFGGSGPPPVRLEWNGELPGGGSLRGGEVYAHRLRLVYEDGSVVHGPRRVFGVDQHTSFGLTMTGDAFATGSAELTAKAREALSLVARDIRRSVGETVFVEGHTDSVGGADVNMHLSRERAEAAARYLVDHERIPRERLTIRAYGTTRPIASNATAEGRELNRRVEIYGNRTDIQKSPLRDVIRGRAAARVNGQEVAVDSAGRFACRVPAAGDSLEVMLTDRSERTARARVRLPRLEILEPSGKLLLPFGGEAPGARVDPREFRPLEKTEVVSLKSVGRGRRAASLRLRARTDPGVRASVDGRNVPVGKDGSFETELPLHLGRNAFGVVLQDSTGVMTVGNVVVRVLDRAEDGGEVIAVEKIPDMTVYMPPSGSVLSTPILAITGETDGGNRVYANGDSLQVAPNGTFSGHLRLPEGRSRVTVEVVDSAGRRGRLERYVEVRSKRMFLVALADGVVGGGGGGPRGETGTWTDGRIAYQLRGWIAGRVLVTSVFDSQQRSWGSLFRDLDDSGRDRLITNLDPDRLYPVFGDASVVSYGAPGGGRFYVALEADAVKAAVGDFPIALDEVELAAFHRTLYGAQLQIQSTALASNADPGSRGSGTSLKVFGAEAGHVHVRDVLEATGGTLYYLSHRDAIEGSVQVTISVHDRNTGLPLTRQPQIRGVDYIVKEVEGRILFSRPISSVSDDGSLLDAGQLGGNPVFIEIDYEATGALAEKAAVGGRLSQTLGPIQVGGTMVQDETGTSPYTLRGGDARLRLGAHSWLGTEFAQSEGRASRVFGSADGGFSFSQFDTGSAGVGDAWKVATEVDPGEWFGSPGRVTVGGFVKRVDEGFVSDSETGSVGSRRFGARAQVNSGRWGIWSGRFDRDERFASAAFPTPWQSDLLGAQWRRDGRRMGVTAEFEDRRADSTLSHRLGGMRLWYLLSDSLRTTVEHQHSLGGPELGQSAVGVEWRLPMGLALEGRASDGTEGRAFRGGASFAVGGRRLYLREEVLDGPSGQQGMTVVGVQTPLGRMSRAYSEYQWLRHDGNYSASSVVGAEQGWQFSSGFRGSVYGEHGGRAGGSASLPHTSVAMQLGYSGKFPLGLSTRGEYRKMDAGSLDRQFLVATHLDLLLMGGFSLLGDHRLSEALPRGPGEATRYEERSVGMAYRPPRSDRIEALARLTDLQDRRAAEPFDSLRATSGLTVAAVEVRMRLWPDLEWAAKGAYRVMREGAGDIEPSDAHSMLWVSRLDYAFAGPFRLGVQYQQLSQREAGDRRGGWLQELTWDPDKHLRFGVGYNFTRISGNEFDRMRSDADGWFVRAQSRY